LNLKDSHRHPRHLSELNPISTSQAEPTSFAVPVQGRSKCSGRAPLSLVRNDRSAAVDASLRGENGNCFQEFQQENSYTLHTDYHHDFLSCAWCSFRDDSPPSGVPCFFQKIYNNSFGLESHRIEQIWIVTVLTCMPCIAECPES
jgi:hypothetical protein